MARLEIELVGINKNLKQTLKDAKVDLSSFANSIANIKPTGINTLNNSLRETKKILSEITRQANSATAALSKISKAQLGQGTSFVAPGADAEIDKARRAEAAYREETQRLIVELNKLKLATAQSRQQTVAAKGSYKEAQQSLTALGKAIREAEGGFTSTNPKIQAQVKQYRELNEKLKAFDAQLGNHQRNVGNYQKALQGIGSYLTNAFGFTALLAVGKKVLDNNAQISDSLSDVRRTAGLTAAEAENLANVLKTIDTRTGLKDLLGIATIGGQLGISKNQLAGFTKAIDELSVALGGELQGGAEGIAKSLGVLDNVFDVTKSNAGDVNKAYNQIGSAILGLGQSGLATGDFLADFGERVGGLAKQAGLSVPIILSYGAVLQESGVSAEVAGTAFKRLLSSLASNSAGFLKVAQLSNANLTLKEFNTIVNTDTRKALDLFFQGLQKGGSSTVAFNTILKSLKLSGGGVSQVIAALSQNQESLNGHIQDATKDFNEATLASEQFALKNDNLAGSIDKLSNTFTNATTSGAISNFFKNIVDGLNASLSAFDKLANSGSYKTFFSRLAGNFSGRGTLLADLTDETDRLKKLTDVERNLEFFRAKSREKQRQAIADQTIFRDKAYEQATGPGSNKTLIANYNKEQAILVALRKEYKANEVQIKKTARSNAETPAGFGPKSKKPAGGGGSSSFNYGGKISDLTARAVGSADVSELDDLDKKNTQTRIKYEGLLRDLEKTQTAYRKKYKDNLGKLSELDAQSASSRKTIQLSLERELNANASDFAQKKADIIAGIEEKAGIVREVSLEKEIQVNDAYYSNLERQYQGHADILAAIAEARVTRTAAINKKYYDKTLEDESNLYTKIQDLTEKGFIDNISGGIKGQQRLEIQLKERLSAIKEYYDKLRKLAGNDVIKLFGLSFAQSKDVASVTSQNTAAKTPELSQQKEAIRGVVDSFGRDLSNTLRNIKTTADGTFTGIFSSLTGSLTSSLNDILLNQFTKKLSDSLNKTGDKLKLTLNDAVAGLGLAGSLISGLSSKTSAAGQGIGGALSGAAAGFAVGGPLGAAIGGGLGLLSGLFGASKAKKEEQIQQQQLNEQKRQTALLERANALAYASQIVGRQTLNGLIQSVDINEFGQVITKVAGNDLLIIHDRTVANRKRGK